MPVICQGISFCAELTYRPRKLAHNYLSLLYASSDGESRNDCLVSRPRGSPPWNYIYVLLTIKRRQEVWRNCRQNARAAACYLGCNFILTIHHFTMNFIPCIVECYTFDRRTGDNSFAHGSEELKNSYFIGKIITIRTFASQCGRVTSGLITGNVIVPCNNCPSWRVSQARDNNRRITCLS